MEDKTLYAKLLGLTPPWGVEKVELKLGEGEVHVWVALPPSELWVCPDCHERSPIHDHRERVWRHLDTFQYRTLLHARLPRLNCSNHGVKQIRVPWAEEGSRFTALFEALAIDWMKQAPISAVSRRLQVSWDEAAGIQDRAVRRGLARRRVESVRYLGIDETSFQRRHEYVTVVSDLEKSRVLFVADGHRCDSLDGFWSDLTPDHKRSIEAIAMDMWDPYILSVRDNLPAGKSKIVFDKFHVAKHLNHAVDLVRRKENYDLVRQGKDWLKGTKYDWLRHPDDFSPSRWRQFLQLARKSRLKTARAWAIKEDFMAMWDYRSPSRADAHFRSWCQWARRSRLQPIRDVAERIAARWENLRTYFTHRITNAGAESINSKIQRVKAMARGFRNRDRFRNAILFHCGGLDLYPAPLRQPQ